MNIQIRRIYEPPAETDGYRILVDRLWPRGLSKEKAKIDWWPRELSPSDALRKWYQHDPEKWPEFRKRYFQELQQQAEFVEQLAQKVQAGKVTFLYSAKNEELNNAVALKEYIEKM